MRDQPILATRTIRQDGVNVPLTMNVVGGLNYIYGNHAPYFSLTVDIHRKGFPDQCQSGGCDHETILKYYPQFADLAELHLSDIDGVPMYAVENGWYNLVGAIGGLGQDYHVGNSERNFPITPLPDEPRKNTECRKPTRDECLQIFANYVRISFAEAREIVTEVAQIASAESVKKAKEYWTSRVDGMKPRWKQEAAACIAKHNLRIYGDE